MSKYFFLDIKQDDLAPPSLRRVLLFLIVLVLYRPLLIRRILCAKATPVHTQPGYLTSGTNERFSLFPTVVVSIANTMAGKLP